jgi:choline dehydrogenase
MMATAEAAGLPITRTLAGECPEGFRARRADRRPPGPPGQRGDRLSQAGGWAANLDVRSGVLVRSWCSKASAASASRSSIGGEPKVIRARREVIVSGGTYNSPHLLMLSGIGPAAHLRTTASRCCTTARVSAATCRNIRAAASSSDAKETVTFLNQLRWDRIALNSLRWAADRHRHDGDAGQLAATW